MIDEVEMPKEIDCYVDSNWANCQTTRKSTSAGSVRIGQTVVTSWSRTQAIQATSSGEAEFYAIAVGIAETLFVINLLLELGYPGRKGRSFSDSSSGRSMVARLGCGKMKHLSVKVLRSQEHVKRKHVTIHKVDGDQNPADLQTKHQSGERHRWLCQVNGLRFGRRPQ